ncbi:MAG: DUF4179 domain-containing protein [Bacillota bacterium]|nr:DUF4179 domain-containing protein [Bacillota bacterium]
MNYNSQNGFEQIKIPGNLNKVVLNTIKKAQRDKKKKKVIQNMMKCSIVAASLLVVLIISVNFVPTFAQSMNKIPIIGKLVKYFEIYHDDGIKKAVENNFVQAVSLKASNNGITTSIDTVIADNKKVIITYSFTIEKGYDNLQELLPGNFSITDKEGRLILSSKGCASGVKELYNDSTGKIIDFVRILEIYSQTGDNYDKPAPEYLNKFRANVFQYISKNKDFTKTKKSTGTIEIEALDGNTVIPDELNIQFTKLTEAYYQPDDEATNQKNTKVFTRKAFVDKNKREAINIDGLWNVKLTLDKEMKNIKPQIIENVNYTTGDIAFAIDKVEAFPTEVNMNMIIGSNTGKAIEFLGFKNAYFTDNNGRKYNGLPGSTYTNSNHKLTVNFESFYFDNPKELYLVIDGFKYCCESDNGNIKSVDKIKIKLK